MPAIAVRRITASAAVACKLYDSCLSDVAVEIIRDLSFYLHSLIRRTVLHITQNGYMQHHPVYNISLFYFV